MTPASVLPSTLDWGRTRHEAAWRRQEELVARRLAGDVGDTLVLRRGAEGHIVWDEAARAQAGVELVQTNRGGDVTYHGPGQIVGYPVVSLETRRDLHGYLRLLEQVLIQALASFDLKAERRPGLTGIWLGTRKVAAIGIAVRRWVTYHGFALNLSPDLSHFSGIVPCGIAAGDGTVTSMAAELGTAPDGTAVKLALAAEFWTEWEKFLAEPPPAQKNL
jgi:lipoyl(octanoyl) transferase